MPSELDAIDVALLLAAAFDRLGVGYFLGGSLASSIQGEPRATNDINLVVDLSELAAVRLAEPLGHDFDVDTQSLREAARRRSSWNIFHLPSMTKVDLFILKDEPFDQSEFSRRQPLEVQPGRTLMVKSAEDTVLRKLWWREATT